MNEGLADTIFALSSGAPPAALAIVRISGPAAAAAVAALAGKLPPARVATLAVLRDPSNGELLDRGLILWFPGPMSATGEDLAELHLHGGRAVVAAVLGTLGRIAGMRPAEAGEFTRRAFANGRIDLAEAEGLADLLSAETEWQRRKALEMAEGAISRRVADWQARLTELAARVEAAIDFADEGDVGEADVAAINADIHKLRPEINSLLGQPTSRRLRDGIRVVIGGPPNAGKSTLFNALVGRDAAIVSPREGTTRDLIEAPIAIAGIPFLLIDSAGLREAADEVEAIGVDRATSASACADILIWLGHPAACPPGPIAVRVSPQCDRRSPAAGADMILSAKTGEGVKELVEMLIAHARALLPRLDRPAMNDRQAALAARAIAELVASDDLLLLAEGLRRARWHFDELRGASATESLLDALFARFCIGK